VCRRGMELWKLEARCRRADVEYLDERKERKVLRHEERSFPPHSAHPSKLLSQKLATRHNTASLSPPENSTLNPFHMRCVPLAFRVF